MNRLDASCDWLDRNWCRANLDDKAFELLTLIIPKLKEVYQDKFDIKFTNGETEVTMQSMYGQPYTETSRFLSRIEVIVHYPQFNITNSTGESHEIKDLYVMFAFKRDTPGMKFSFETNPGILGYRTSLTPDEYKVKYRHSHLQASNLTTDVKHTFTKFCKGSGAIVQAMLMVQQSFDAYLISGNLNVNIFKLFLLQLNSYVVWESLSGVPHIHMKKIGKVTMVEEAEYSDSQLVMRVLKTLKEKVNNFSIANFKWNIQRDKVEITSFEKFEEYFNPVLSNDISQSIYPDSWLCTKDSVGNYYELNPGYDEAYRLRATISFYFRGEPVKFQIVKPTTLPPPQRRFLNPNYLKNVKQYLESKFNTAKTAAHYLE